MKNTSIQKKQKPRAVFFGALFILAASSNSYAEQREVLPDGTAYLIFDNTAGKNTAAIVTNMSTKRTPNCTADDVLKNQLLNCFALGSNDIQVVQNDGTGTPVSMIGINNSKATSYENMNKPDRRFLFSPGKDLFDIDQYRVAADSLSSANTNLPSKTYGSITFFDFLLNIARNDTMHGIVRVKIPLLVTQNPLDVDGNSTGSTLSLCGEEQREACNYACGPGTTTSLTVGHTICAVQFPEGANININGSLMFDWVDSVTDAPIRPDQFPSDSSLINLDISIPLNINPAHVGSDGLTLESISDIQSITGTNQCANGSPCEAPLASSVPYSLIPSESKAMYEYIVRDSSGIGIPLDEPEFNKLSKTDQYHLLFPSGYAKGWHSAFEELKITPTIWNNLAFDVEVDPIEAAEAIKNNIDPNTLTISENSVRSESFSDIPALIYTGGLIRIRHHTNISGLIYASQAIEISQKSTGGRVVASKPAQHTPIEASLQYFNGAIIVRDGFYFEAEKQGGITLISNNPDSYSNTRLLKGPGIDGNFKAYDAATVPPVAQNHQNADTSIFTGQLSVAATATTPTGTQWVEIRPK